MSAKTNQEKNAQLGVNFGTASYRLKKMILFGLIRRLGETACFRCKTDIVSADDLSIDHKKPWLGVSNDLFWDLDNIAFSHTACNRPDRPSGPKKKTGPEGTAWCSSCQDFRPVELFGEALRNLRLTRGYCNPCRKEKGWKK